MVDHTLALSIPEAVKVSSLSRTAIYAALKTGNLQGRKVGRRTIIPTSELERFIDALPSYQAAA